MHQGKGGDFAPWFCFSSLITYCSGLYAMNRRGCLDGRSFAFGNLLRQVHPFPSPLCTISTPFQSSSTKSVPFPTSIRLCCLVFTSFSDLLLLGLWCMCYRRSILAGLCTRITCVIQTLLVSLRFLLFGFGWTVIRDDWLKILVSCLSLHVCFMAGGSVCVD